MTLIEVQPMRYRPAPVAGSRAARMVKLSRYRRARPVAILHSSDPLTDAEVAEVKEAWANVVRRDLARRS